MERQDQLRFRSYRFNLSYSGSIRLGQVPTLMGTPAGGVADGGESATARPAGVFAIASEARHVPCGFPQLHGVHRGEGGKRLLNLGNHSPVKFVQRHTAPYDILENKRVSELSTGGIGRWQPDREGGPSAELRLNVNFSAMLLDDPAAQPQSQPCPARLRRIK